MDRTPERWEAIAATFDEATRLPVGERGAFVSARCADDPALRDEVLRLLAADASSGETWLEGGALGLLDEGDPHLGERFGAFRVVERIGQGGMGSVYRAERCGGDFEQVVAVKLLRLGAESPALAERFARERRALASLVHPHVARLVDGGTSASGTSYIAMELVEGLPLTESCRSRGLARRDRVALFALVCRAVHFAHVNLVLHLDLKPANILVDSDGAPKLLDFGVAALLAEATPLGSGAVAHGPLTPEYASPEHVRGEPVSTASDVYSLGVVLREVLTDRPAGDRSVPLPKELESIVGLATHPEPARRYASCQALADDLERWLHDLPVLAMPATFRYRTTKFLVRHRLAVAAGAMLALASLVGVLSTLRMAALAREERDVAREARARTEAQMGHARIEATSSELLAGFLGDTFLSAEFVGDPSARERARRAMLERAERSRRQHAKDPHLLANLLDALGRSCARIDAFADAERLMDEAAALRRSHFGESSVEFAQSLASLGRLAYQRGQYGLAVQHLRERYRLHKLCPKDVHTDVAAAANDLAAAERAVGERVRARELHAEALAIRRGSAADEILVAESLNNLAAAEPDLGRASALLEEALQIRARVLGADDPSTVQSRVNLGRVAIARGDHAGARPHLEEAVAASRRVGALGRDALGPALGSLAYVLFRLDDLAAARRAIDEALVLDRSRLGADHPRVAEDLEVRASVLAAEHAVTDVVACWVEALRIRRAAFPPGHRQVTNSLLGLGGAYVRAAKPEEAETVLAEAIALLARDEQRRSEDVTEAQTLRATALEALGRFEEAEAALRGALAESGRAERVRGLLHAFLVRRGRAAEAESFASSRPSSRDR